MKRILLLGAGGPAGLNVIDSLHGHYFLFGTDCNAYHLHWLTSKCARSFLVPRNTNPIYVKEINRIIVENQIDMVMAQPDSEVMWLSEHRDEIDAITFLPPKETIRICANKHRSAEAWESVGFETAKSIKIESYSDLENAFLELGSNLWIRAVDGAGGKGSTPASNIETAWHWIQYWWSREPTWKFMAQENLTGRNIAWSSVWHKGQLVIGQGRERLEYIYPHLAPSGITGTPSVARTIDEPEVNKLAIKAIMTIDPEPHGVFSVDLKYSKNGLLIPTEINAGRFFTTSNFFSQAADRCQIPDANMPLLVVKMALENYIPFYNQVNPLPENLYWIRHIDCPAILKTL